MFTRGTGGKRQKFRKSCFLTSRAKEHLILDKIDCAKSMTFFISFPESHTILPMGKKPKSLFLKKI